MAYPDDKSMTELVGNVHLAVMQGGYTLTMTIVLVMTVKSAKGEWIP
jgi:hypothetical protein